MDALDSKNLCVPATLPIKHEILFTELTKAGFNIELRSGESPIDVIISFCEYMRIEKVHEIERVADVFRNNGHSHLVIYLYNEEIKLCEDFNISDVSKYFPEIEVNIQPVSETDFRLPSETVYKMSSSPRGLALVINNRKFEYDNNEIRYGSERDYKYLTELFSGLGYKVYSDENLTAEEMQNAIKSFAQSPEHQFTDSCVVALSTHGFDNNWLQGIDGGALDIDLHILTHFNNINCPFLKGKPKLFFIQACRGAERDLGTGEEIDSKLIMEMPMATRFPSWSDIAIIQSTVPGYVSNRSQCEGSWFVQAIVKVFMAHSHDKDLETLLKMVTRNVMRFQTIDREMQAPEITYRGWTKSLYFNPLDTNLE